MNTISTFLHSVSTTNKIIIPIVIFILLGILCYFTVVAVKKWTKKNMLRKIAKIEDNHQKEIKALTDELAACTNLTEKWNSACNGIIEFLENTDDDKYSDPKNIAKLKEMALLTELLCDEETHRLMSKLINYSENLYVIEQDSLTELEKQVLDIIKAKKKTSLQTWLKDI